MQSNEMVSLNICSYLEKRDAGNVTADNTENDGSSKIKSNETNLTFGKTNTKFRLFLNKSNHQRNLFLKIVVLRLRPADRR